LVNHARTAQIQLARNELPTASGRIHPHHQPGLGLLSAAALSLLQACGGGGGGSAPVPQPPAGPTQLQLDNMAASRFLAQAAWGGNTTLIDTVRTTGARAWLQSEMSRTVSSSMKSWLIAKGFNDASVASNVNGEGGWVNAMWAKLFAGSDAVRQRAVLAWSEIFVVSVLGLPISWRNFALANHWENLEKHAFGNFRNLLEAVTLSSAMGTYLNMKGNQKTDTKTGRAPDENYAREVMQLFTIGLYQLNADGSLKLDASGKPVETYDNTDIQGLARVFTGWNTAPGQDPQGLLADAAYRHGLPMALNASLHSPEEKRFLGVVIPAGTDGTSSLKVALDTLFNHPNTAPFVCKQLIQRLVTSNPSPAYVGRVASVFANNGQGVRGDLQAVWQAILLDVEVTQLPTAATAGKLREPVVRLVQWGRTFQANSTDGLWSLGHTDADTSLGQMPLLAPSVFNFFRPGYVPPNTALSTQKLVAPEFQIATEPTVTGYVNYMAGTVNNARNVQADYSNELLLASTPVALVASLSLTLAAGALSDANQALIAQAIASMPDGTAAARNNRVYAAVLLVMASADYLIQR
jgi:uncharacterized protein (DUF1800 family)